MDKDKLFSFYSTHGWDPCHNSHFTPVEPILPTDLLDQLTEVTTLDRLGPTTFGVG